MSLAGASDALVSQTRALPWSPQWGRVTSSPRALPQLVQPPVGLGTPPPRAPALPSRSDPSGHLISVRTRPDPGGHYRPVVNVLE